MYEVDHERCFLVEKGATIKADNAMFYHGEHYYYTLKANSEKVPMRHAGWCERSAVEVEEAVGWWGDEVELAAAAQETEALAFHEEGAASGVTFVHVMAAFGFAVTVYGAFRHYVK